MALLAKPKSNENGKHTVDTKSQQFIDKTVKMHYVFFVSTLESI